MRLMRTTDQSTYTVPPVAMWPQDCTKLRHKLAEELEQIARVLNNKPSVDINSLESVFLEGDALCTSAGAVPPTAALKGNFAVALYPDSADTDGHATTLIRIPGTYTVYVVWAPDTLPATPTTKSVWWEGEITPIARDLFDVGNPETNGLTSNASIPFGVGTKLPATADMVCFHRLTDSLRVDDFSVVGISLNRLPADGRDDAAVDVYVLGVLFERTGGV